MDKRINNLVNIYFDDICYSAEAADARKNIEAELNRKFEEMTSDMPKDEAFEDFIEKYGKLTDMAELAGYTADDVERWRSVGEARDIKSLKKSLRKHYRLTCGISLCAVFAVTQLLWLIYDLFSAPIAAIFVFVYFALLAGGAVFLYRRLCRLENKHRAEKYDIDAYEYLRRTADKYAKRKLNTTALLFAVIALLGLTEFNIYVLGNSKFAELIESIFTNIILIQIPLYFRFKSGLYQKVISRKCNLPGADVYRKHLIGITLFSAVYWSVAAVIALVFCRSMYNPENVLLVSGVLFAASVLIYNLTFRKKLTYKNIVVNKARIAVFTSAAVLISGYTLLQRDTWYTQPYINSIPVVKMSNNKITYNEDNGVYTITAEADEFRILHLTDIHLGGSLYSYRKDIKALNACYAEIEHTKPDLVIVTGDLCFPLGIMSMSINNSAPVNQFAAFMRNTGVPWAFTYGNHDTESLSTLSGQELNEVYKALSYKTSGTLLYPYIQPDVTGRNNQLIEVRNSDGSLNTALFLIDSNAYTGEGINDYDYIHDDQVEWYADEVQRLNKEEGHTVNSLAFFHMPLQQYRTAYELYEAGSSEVTYFFGENGEKMIDKVCCSDYPSNLFDRMLELGSTKGVFCGHDHYNNMSLEYKGIRLTYGMSIDYLAMPGIESDTAQRGAELITLYPDGSWHLEQIPLEAITE